MSKLQNLPLIVCFNKIFKKCVGRSNSPIHNKLLCTTISYLCTRIFAQIELLHLFCGITSLESAFPHGGKLTYLAVHHPVAKSHFCCYWPGVLNKSRTFGDALTQPGSKSHIYFCPFLLKQWLMLSLLCFLLQQQAQTGKLAPNGCLMDFWISKLTSAPNTPQPHHSSL